MNKKGKLVYVQKLIDVFGVSAFLGSVFSITVLARIHDFTNDWVQVVQTRDDMIQLIHYITYPGLILVSLSIVIYTLSDPSVLAKWTMRVIIILMGFVILNTMVMVVPAVEELRDLANEAIYSSDAGKQFLTYHIKEDLFGSINLLAFIGIVMLRQRLDF